MPSNRSHTERALRFVAIKYNGSHVTYPSYKDALYLE